MSHCRAVIAYDGSLFLIDDGIDINVLNDGRHRLEQRHVATGHHFDGNPRVIID